MTIGQKLSEKRRELGKTIKEIELILKIRSPYLEAIENDEFEKLPSLTYARAFLSDYASYLGLDKEKVLEEFDALYLSRTEEEKFKPPKFVFPEWSGTFLAFLFLAILFFWGIYYLFSYIGSQAPAEKPQIETKTTTPEPSKPVKPSPAPKKTTPTEQPAPPTPQKVTVRVRITGKASWIRVEVDGEKVYEGMMKQGDEKKWEGKEVRLRVGNASSTEVTVDGKVVELGRSATGIIEKVFRGGADEP